jgi:hypothetical protein
MPTLPQGRLLVLCMSPPSCLVFILLDPIYFYAQLSHSSSRVWLSVLALVSCLLQGQQTRNRIQLMIVHGRNGNEIRAVPTLTMMMALVSASSRFWD